MDGQKLADILAAFSMLSEDGALDKKPNVTDVEAVTGFDVSAAERDEAWEVFTTVDVVADGADELRAELDAEAERLQAQKIEQEQVAAEQSALAVEQAATQESIDAQMKALSEMGGVVELQAGISEPAVLDDVEVTNVKIVPSVCINGITINAGDTATVPDFNRDKAVFSLWLSNGFIAAS